MNRFLGRFRLLVPPGSYVITYVLIYVAFNIPVFLWVCTFRNFMHLSH